MSETKQEDDDTVMSPVHSAVFKESENLAGKCLLIEGYDFNRGTASQINAHNWFSSFQLW